MTKVTRGAGQLAYEAWCASHGRGPAWRLIRTLDQCAWAAAEQASREAERAAVVEFLRREFGDLYAVYIEAGKHHSAPSLPKVGDGWVRCSERMPDPDVPLDEEAWSLVYAPARGRDMASWDGERWIWRSHGYAIPSEVTHWRPLPPPPGEEPWN